ncbi:MAG: DNA topoisomerase IV subunit B, partial [Flavobacteriales bacterium]|nr:DNA topoisomerase IV subunit B [Flavobacteriales bacterium]
GKEPLYKPPIYILQEKDNVFVEVAMQHAKDYYDEGTYSFVNCIKTKEGGTHLVGFKSAITKAINLYGRKNNILKENESLQGEDIREGLTAVVNLRIANPQFEGQTKTKLGNSEVKGIVDSVVNDGLAVFLDKNPAAAKALIERALIAYRVRAAARKAQELERKKSALDTATLPGKLADCSESNAEKCEVFLVEGDSAGGSAKQGRDRRFQAILPLRGKILNVEKAMQHRIFDNEEIKNIYTALGVRIGTEEDSKALNIEKLRYHKVVIMCDADVDGSHIATLILTFFFRYMKELIELGYIYIAAPPLYLVKKGAQQHYAWTDTERDDIATELKGGKDINVNIQRYKGLGEMNAEQLWETTMNPSFRTMRRVTIDNAADADHTFSMLMGDEVPPRREFIEKNAKYAKIDV